MLLMAMALAGAQQDAASGQTNYTAFKEGVTCSFKRYPDLALLELTGMNLRVAHWTQLKPVTAKGPPATLDIMYNRPHRPGGDPWLVIFSVDFLPGSVISHEAVESWTISIDGAVMQVPRPTPMITIPAPAADPSAPPPEPRPPEGPRFLATPDDAWFARLASARLAIVEFRNAAGKVLGHYQWNLEDIGKGRTALDRTDWTCVKLGS